MSDWIKHNKILFILLIIALAMLLFIIIPVVINVAYINNNGYITVWGAEDVLLFYGAALSFIGTVFLGGLALWQNEKLNKINKNLTEHQNKPILTNSLLIDLNDFKEKHRTFYRTIEQNSSSVMINNGYSSQATYSPYAIISLQNIGLGPAVTIETYMYRLKSVDGLQSLDEISARTIDDFYNKIHFENYEYYENGGILTNEWIIFTSFNLGIAEENNKLNLIFSFENIIEPVHCILEFRYKNVLGSKFKQYLYMSYDNEPSVLPISEIYENQKEIH